MEAYKSLGMVQSGEVSIIDSGESFKVLYANKCYKNSPFECPVSFSKEFTKEQIILSGELAKFLSRFDVFLPRLEV
jgi:hypothetical protein